jgi:hypothetical protein
MDDDEFDYLRERTPEQEEAADDVEPNPDAGVPGDRGGQGGDPRRATGGDVDGERTRTPEAGL